MTTVYNGINSGKLVDVIILMRMIGIDHDSEQPSAS